MIIDAHSHPQLSDFKDNYLQEWADHRLVAAATDYQDFLFLKKLSSNHPCLRFTIGIHPWKIRTIFPEEEFNLIKNHLKHQKLPIGEIGLDHSKKYQPYIETQRKLLYQFFILAAEFKLPLILHSVKTHHEILSFLKQFPKQKILLHGFKGSKEVKKQYLRYDCYFGLPIGKFKHQINELPLERIFLESDGLLPLSQFRIAYEELAQIKDISSHQLEKQIEENYHSFFKYAY